MQGIGKRCIDVVEFREAGVVWSERIRLDVARSAEATVTAQSAAIDGEGAFNDGEFLALGPRPTGKRQVSGVL